MKLRRVGRGMKAGMIDELGIAFLYLFLSSGKVV